MIHLHDVRYVRIGCSDLAKTVRFCTDILGLENVGDENGAVYLRGDDRDHNVCLFAGDPRDHTVGFELRTEAELKAAFDELRRSGVDVTAGSDVDARKRRVDAFITFRDPTGNKIDLVNRPYHSGRRYFPSRDAGILEFGHVGLNTTDPRRDEAFWCTVLNARVSDRIGEAPLLRIDAVHHKIALFPTDRAGIQHVNFQVASVDDIMRSWYFLQERQVPIAFGPGRHPTSTAMFLYFYGPDDLIWEYSYGVRRIENEDTYVPRQFPFATSSFCMWGAVPKIKEFS